MAKLLKYQSCWTNASCRLHMVKQLSFGITDSYICHDRNIYAQWTSLVKRFRYLIATQYLDTAPCCNSPSPKGASREP